MSLDLDALSGHAARCKTPMVYGRDGFYWFVGPPGCERNETEPRRMRYENNISYQHHAALLAAAPELLALCREQTEERAEACAIIGTAAGLQRADGSALTADDCRASDLLALSRSVAGAVARLRAMCQERAAQLAEHTIARQTLTVDLFAAREALDGERRSVEIATAELRALRIENARLKGIQRYHAQRRLEDTPGKGCPGPGREAEELRKGLEAMTSGATQDEIQALLDRVNARDSLAYLEERGRAVEEIERLRQRVAWWEARQLDAKRACSVPFTYDNLVKMAETAGDPDAFVKDYGDTSARVELGTAHDSRALMQYIASAGWKVTQYGTISDDGLRWGVWLGVGVGAEEGVPGGAVTPEALATGLAQMAEHHRESVMWYDRAEALTAEVERLQDALLAASELANREAATAEANARLAAEERARADRLARILAVERGDASAVPSGWDLDPERNAWRNLAGAEVVRFFDDERDVYRWFAEHGSGEESYWYHYAETALEAIEAADAARGAT